MHVASRETYAEIFARKAEITRELQARLLKEMNDRALVDRENQRIKSEATTLEYVAAELATQERIEAFTEMLDRQDAATVEALMENEEERAAVRARIADMFERAQVLPDGRRVFETRDGTKVYDEHGNEVGRDVIAPEDIDDSRPKWEDLQEEKERQRALEKEREELQEHQDKIDEAREKAADPEVTEDQLDALEKELQESAPDRVRRKVEEPSPDAAPAAPASQPTPNAAPTYMP